MPIICYREKRFGMDSLRMIRLCNEVIAEYREQGFELTLRSLYYKMVARDLFPDDRKWTWTGAKWIRDPEGTKNAEPNYNWLGDIINDARLAGKMDWNSILDLTRNLASNSHWTSPRDIVDTCSRQYRIDTWLTQPAYCEVWIEKDALEGVIAPTCSALDIPFFSCRGYGSQSALWSAGQRLRERFDDGKEIVILHLGDHDPSGIDMTRDIQDRLEMFAECTVDVRRLALNMNQVRQYRPPPNPAKLTDSRAKEYIKAFGSLSWELDALEPNVLTALVTNAVAEFLDTDAMERAKAIEKQHRDAIKNIIPKMPKVSEWPSEDY